MDEEELLPIWNPEGLGLRGSSADTPFAPMSSEEGVPEPFGDDPPLAQPAVLPGALSSGLTGPLGNVGPQGPTGPRGSRGTHGATGAPGPRGSRGSRGSTGPRGTRGPTGLKGAQGSQGPRGTIGPTGPRGAPGSTGPQGLPGPRGSTGPKGGVIKTPLGNVVFSCIEANRPYLLNVIRMRSNQKRAFISPKLMASIVHGSEFVFSAVPAKKCRVIASIKSGVLTISRGSIKCVVTVVVAGINKRFPNWDMPLVSDAAMVKSNRWWAQEWV